MGPLALAAIATVPKIVGGIFGKSQHNKYADMLMGLEKTMPESILRAEGLYEEQATQGLPGFESIKSDIEGTMSSTVAAGKQVIDSPSALLGLLAELSANVAGGVRKLGVEDEMARLRNKMMLAQFLTSAKAPAEMRIEDFDIDKQIGAEKERMTGSAALWQEITGGIGSGLTAYGMGTEMDFMKDKLGIMKAFWENQGQTGKVPTPGLYQDSPIDYKEDSYKELFV